MMAACLEMRASNISNLNYEHINWEKSAISFYQKNTNQFLILPLLPTAGETIIDYLKNGWPHTDSQYVFVKYHPPFRQISRHERRCFSWTLNRKDSTGMGGLCATVNTLLGKLITNPASHTLLTEAAIGFMRVKKSYTRMKKLLSLYL